MPAKPKVSEPCQVDEQGRTIIPKAVREALGLKTTKSYVTYELDGDSVRLRKVEWSVK